MKGNCYADVNKSWNMVHSATFQNIPEHEKKKDTKQRNRIKMKKKLKNKTETQKQLFLYFYKIKFNVSEGNFYKTKYGVGTEGRQAKRSVVNDHNE